MESKNEIFIEKAKKVHGDKYDYSKVEYVNANTKVCIICPIHGEFWQTPHSHVSGAGCPKCGLEKIRQKNTKNTETFIKAAKQIHGDKYDYSKVNYINKQTKVCIICPIHGEFWQKPEVHLHGSNCPKCSKEKVTKTQDEFLNQCKKVHGDKYDYSKVEYINAYTKVCIICPIHGEFWQRPFNHLHGNGCPKCKAENIGNIKRKGLEVFTDEANSKHKNKYIYSASTYVNTDTPIKIVCPIHGEFWQRPHDHLKGCGCPKCANQQSLLEGEICEFLYSYLGGKNIVRRTNKLLKNNKEIDIYIPSLRVGIEFNGLHWHTEQFEKDKFYHLKKTNEAQENGIKLLQIFEDEYKDKKEIVLSKILHILNIHQIKPKIYGRETQIKLIDKNDAYAFLEKYHIQGFAPSSVYLGAYYNNQLIGVTSFTKEKNNVWNLTRMCTDINYNCCGVCGKMLKFFLKNFEWQTIKTFADRRWTTSSTKNLYTRLGFMLDKVLPPSYSYVVEKKRVHKFNFRKKTLSRRYDLPMSLSEKEMAQKLGYYRIWDCGLYKYIIKK